MKNEILNKARSVAKSLDKSIKIYVQWEVLLAEDFVHYTLYFPSPSPYHRTCPFSICSFIFIFNSLLRIFQVRYTYVESNIVSIRYIFISEKAHVVEHCIT